MSTRATIITTVAVIASLVIGGFAGAAIEMKRANDQPTTSNSKTADSSAATTLRVNMNNLLREHVTTNLNVSRAIINNKSEAEITGAQAAQTANAVAIATAVGSVYGQEAQTAITGPFVEHLVQSNKYAIAVRDGNTSDQAAAKTALEAELRKIATIFNSVIPSVPTDSLYAALDQHEQLMNQVATEYKNGNYERAYQLESEALTQISGGADVLTTGIIASKPDMF